MPSVLNDMGFYGVEVPAKGKKTVQVVDNEEQDGPSQAYLHITNVALGEAPADGPHVLKIDYQGNEIVVATLQKNLHYQHALDFVIDGEATFINSGPSVLFVHGYQTVAYPQGESSDDYDYDDDGEDEDEDMEDAEEDTEDVSDEKEAPEAVPLSNTKQSKKALAHARLEEEAEKTALVADKAARAAGRAMHLNKDQVAEAGHMAHDALKAGLMAGERSVYEENKDDEDADSEDDEDEDDEDEDADLGTEDDGPFEGDEENLNGTLHKVAKLAFFAKQSDGNAEEDEEDDDDGEGFTLNSDDIVGEVQDDLEGESEEEEEAEEEVQEPPKSAKKRLATAAAAAAVSTTPKPAGHAAKKAKVEAATPAKPASAPAKGRKGDKAPEVAPATAPAKGQKPSKVEAGASAAKKDAKPAIVPKEPKDEKAFEKELISFLKVSGGTAKLSAVGQAIKKPPQVTKLTPYLTAKAGIFKFDAIKQEVSLA